MLKKILIVVAVIVVGFLGFVFTRPDSYHVERTRTIDAPVATVFDLVNDMKARAAWYPWDKLDPNIKRTYSEQTEGVGASYEWSGNDQVGSGRQEILESVENQKVVDSLEFKTPFESTSTASFVFTPKGDHKTEVTWAIDGGDGFQTRVMNVFMSMDDAIGEDFEKGLGYLDDTAKERWEEEQATINEAAALDETGEDAEGDPATDAPVDEAGE